MSTGMINSFGGGAPGPWGRGRIPRNPIRPPTAIALPAPASIGRGIGGGFNLPSYDGAAVRRIGRNMANQAKPAAIGGAIAGLIYAVWINWDRYGQQDQNEGHNDLPMPPGTAEGWETIPNGLPAGGTSYSDPIEWANDHGLGTPYAGYVPYPVRVPILKPGGTVGVHDDYDWDYWEPVLTGWPVASDPFGLYHTHWRQAFRNGPVGLYPSSWHDTDHIPPYPGPEWPWTAEGAGAVPLPPSPWDQDIPSPPPWLPPPYPWMLPSYGPPWHYPSENSGGVAGAPAPPLPPLPSTVTVPRDGPVESSRHPEPNRPPEKKTKEKKIKPQVGRLGYTLSQLIQAGFEIGEVIDILAAASGWKYNKWKPGTFMEQKLEYLFGDEQGIRNINDRQFIEEFTYNVIEDYVIGRISGAASKGFTKLSNRPIGVQTGIAL